MHIYTCPHTRTYSHTQHTLIHKHTLYTLDTLTHTQTHTSCVYTCTPNTLTCIYVRSHAHMHAHTWHSHSQHTHRLIRTDSHTLTHTPWGRAGVGAPGHLLPLSMALPGPPRLPGRRPLNPELCRWSCLGPVRTMSKIPNESGGSAVQGLCPSRHCGARWAGRR